MGVSPQTLTIRKCDIELSGYLIAVCAVISPIIAITAWAQIQSPIYLGQLTPLEFRTSDGATGTLSVVTVSEPQDLARGLMHVRWMPLDRGMLFVFPEDGRISMWMKDTLISLDMWFIKDDGTVVQVVRNTKPRSLERIKADIPCRAVLETNAGLALRLGIGPGAKIQHPSLPLSMR